MSAEQERGTTVGEIPSCGVIPCHDVILPLSTRAQGDLQGAAAMTHPALDAAPSFATLPQTRAAVNPLLCERPRRRVGASIATLTGSPAHPTIESEEDRCHLSGTGVGMAFDEAWVHRHNGRTKRRRGAVWYSALDARIPGPVRHRQRATQCMPKGMHFSFAEVAALWRRQERTP
jgi:hypothetical protein